MKSNQAAFDVGQLAERLSNGYLTYISAIAVATNPKATLLAPPVRQGQIVSIGEITRKDGTAHLFHFNYFLSLANTDELISDELKKVWLTGALLRVGDALSHHNYFDRAPELELLRHLRNGIAHGNRFRIDRPSNLKKYPANNIQAWVKIDLNSIFEITPHLDGTEVLFSYMGPGDILDLLMSIGMYLVRVGNGEPPRIQTTPPALSNNTRLPK